MRIVPFRIPLADYTLKLFCRQLYTTQHKCERSFGGTFLPAPSIALPPCNCETVCHRLADRANEQHDNRIAIAPKRKAEGSQPCKQRAASICRQYHLSMSPCRSQNARRHYLGVLLSQARAIATATRISPMWSAPSSSQAKGECDKGHTLERLCASDGENRASTLRELAVS